MVAEFHFLRPLWFLALIPLPLVLRALARRTLGSRAWQGLVDTHLLPHLVSGETRRVAHLPLWLLGLGWVLVVTALAGPVWERLPQPVFQRQAFRVIVLDLSPEMNAADPPPSRLVRARFEVLDLLDQAREGQTALIAYGPEPFIVSPLTRDTKTIAAQVPELTTDLLPVQGPKRTDLALEAAGRLLAQAGARTGQILLITASLAHPDPAQAAARRLRERGFRVSVLGIGTEKGAPIPKPGGGFLTDAQGAIRLDRLQPQALAALARAGGGRFVRARADAADSRLLLASPSSGEIEKTRERVQADGWREEGPWLLLLVLPLAALAFRRGWLSPLILVLILGPVPNARAFDWSDLWWRPDQWGQRAFASGDFGEAARRFQRPDWRAAAQYREGRFKAALKNLAGLEGSEAAYDRGNALAKLGRFQEAIREYDRAIRLDPKNDDARANRALLQRLLRQRRNPNPSQQSGGGGKDAAPQDQQASGTPSEASSPSNASQDGNPTSPNPSDRDGTSSPRRDRGNSQESQGEQASQSARDRTASENPAQGGRASQKGPTDETEPQDGSEAPKAAPTRNAPEMTQGTSGTEAREEPPSKSQTGTAPSQADLLEHGPTGTAGAPPKMPTQDVTESRQAMEQMLRRVPDDPGGLLRQRFLLQHLRRIGRMPR